MAWRAKRGVPHERGAAAVEFALMFPLVLILLITMIELSRLWNVQATITSAAAVGARYAAVHYDPDLTPAELATLETTSEGEARKVPGFFDWTSATVDVKATCASSGVATSEISVSPGAATEWFGSLMDADFDLEATGAMPCTG